MFSFLKKKPKAEPSPKVEAKPVAEPMPEPVIETKVFEESGPQKDPIIGDYPSARGLHVYEIMLIYFCDFSSKYPLPDPNDYPAIWKRDYNLDDVAGALKSLEDRGFLRIVHGRDKRDYYRPTDRGKAELEDNRYIPFTYSSSYVYETTPLKANALLKGNPPSNWEEILADDYERRRGPDTRYGVH